jgi:hypothetical protein
LRVAVSVVAQPETKVPKVSAAKSVKSFIVISRQWISAVNYRWEYA